MARVIGLIALAAVVVAGGVFAVARGLGSASPEPGDSHSAVPSAATAPASAPGVTTPTAILAKRFSPPVDASGRVTLSRKLPEYGKHQAAVIRSVAQLLGNDVPSVLIQSRLAEADLADLDVALSPFIARSQRLESDRLAAGSKRLHEVYDAGGWEVFPDRPVSVPDPRHPGQVINRRASPYDDKHEDEIIMEMGATGVNGEPESRVVRLRPETDASWRETILEHMAALEDLRLEVRRFFDSRFPERTHR